MLVVVAMVWLGAGDTLSMTSLSALAQAQTLGKAPP